MPRVALIFKVDCAQPMALAGALVRHGLSSGQAMEVIRILAKKDVVLNLTGTIEQLNASFNTHGLVVEERPQGEATEAANIQPLDAAG